MRKKHLMVALFLMTVCSLLLFSVPAYAYNATKAVNYADTYALQPNNSFRYFSGHDCTNFASQIIAAGGVKQSGNWYYNNGHNYSATWTVADSFKWYIKDIYGATRLASGWTKTGRYHGSVYLYPYINNSANIPASGKVVVFYDWHDDGIIDHTSYCVGTGYSLDQNIYSDLVNQHSTNRKRTRWTLDTYNDARYDTAIYAFGL
ncbi:MAG: amidase domain-containing protein [Bacillota bacterium]